MSNDLASPVAMTSQDTLPIVAKPTRRLTELEKRAIVGERTGGIAVKAIAARYNIDPATVWRVCKETQLGTNSPALGASWRAPMLTNAVRSVNDGLTYQGEQYDPYKAMQGGIAVLKGLGEFNADSQVNVAALVTSWPSDLGIPSQIEDQTPPPIDIDAPLSGQ